MVCSSDRVASVSSTPNRVNQWRGSHNGLQFVMRACQWCGKDTKNLLYCSRSCANSGSPRRPSQQQTVSCSGCDASLIRRAAAHGPFFCSNSCQQQTKRREAIKLWIAGEISLGWGASKAALFEIYGEKCSECGWSKKHRITGRCPVQMDHIDGDKTNNSFANLRLLCPNCHSLTETWGGGNTKHGRVKWQT